jgi:3-isopropylmalate/(R)-2-methylmalate dehydratase small subunit
MRLSIMGSEVTVVTGTGIPLVGNDIDTDRIIPARFLKAITFEGLGDQVFVDDRAQASGEHPFDLPQYQGATILVVNNNFGCGSSREHAPQAIARWGIEAIVGESFAEIFLGNCLAMGLPCVTATLEVTSQIQQTLHSNPQAAITVDLEALTVNCEDFTAQVAMGDGPRQMLLAGTWDACGQLLASIDTIRETAYKLPYIAWH